MTIDKFFNYIQKRLQQELPGKEAHLRMAPSPLDGIRNYRMSPEENATNSSVMILLFPGKTGNIKLVFTHRTESISHGGQISFPGGQSDPEESTVDTALREMEEEIGITRSSVTVTGNLSQLYLHRSNNLITPVVGFHANKPEFTVNPVEVQEVFTESLDTFLRDDKLVRESWPLLDKTYVVPYWKVHDVPLWGATAMMLSELMVLYREFLGKDR